MSILVVYDDTGAVPDTIRRVIGAGRFGDIMRRKRRLADTIEAVVDPVAGCEFVRLCEEAEAATLRERIERLPAEAMVFRLPASAVPATDLFAPLVAKLPYALEPVLYGEPTLADPPALLIRDDALAVLGEPDAAARRRLFGALEQRALRVGNVPFLDITQIAAFLAFMAGATEARHFNVTRMNAGIFRKWSADVAKMRGEYTFFHLADEPMKRFLLPTFDFAEEDGGAAYSMEHLSVPDAAMQIVHHTFHPDSFARLLDAFFAFVAARGREPRPAAEVREAGRREIIAKLDRRIASLRDLPAGPQLARLLESAGPHGPLDDLVARCTALVERALADSAIDHLALGHGDPCFSNILYNPEINLFRLIDPRGADTRAAAFMHPAYDIAKFSHSVLGGYDFVNGGLADCRLDDTMRLSLALDRDGPADWMKQAFRTRLAAEGWDLRLVRAIEASLFLSMLPLHVDSPDKLPAFCLIAGEIITELERGA